MGRRHREGPHDVGSRQRQDRERASAMRIRASLAVPAGPHQVDAKRDHARFRRARGLRGPLPPAPPARGHNHEHRDRRRDAGRRNAGFGPRGPRLESDQRALGGTMSVGRGNRSVWFGARPARCAPKSCAHDRVTRSSLHGHQRHHYRIQFRIQKIKEAQAGEQQGDRSSEQASGRFGCTEREAQQECCEADGLKDQRAQRPGANGAHRARRVLLGRAARIRAESRARRLARRRTKPLRLLEVGTTESALRRQRGSRPGALERIVLD